MAIVLVFIKYHVLWSGIGRNCDMIDFVGTPPFLRVAEWVAVEIVHFHTTHNKFILEHFLHEGGPD